jgi:hypothetical protein
MSSQKAFSAALRDGKNSQRKGLMTISNGTEKMFVID